MNKDILDVFEEFCNRLDEPGSLIWKDEWENAIHREKFTDYVNILSKPQDRLIFTSGLEIDDSFSGFVDLKSYKLDIKKRNLQNMEFIISKKNAEFTYLRNGAFRYLQTKDANEIHSPKTLLFMADNFYTTRIYSKHNKQEHELFYFSNCGHFSPQDYNLCFSQFDSDFFNIYLSQSGKSVPLIKIEMDSGLKISNQLVHNPQIFSDFAVFQTLMKDQKCSLFEDFEKKEKISPDKERKNEPIFLSFEKALALL